MSITPFLQANGHGFRAGATTVSDGNMSYRFGPKGEVLENRQRYFEKMSLPAARFLTFFTDHKDDITDWRGGPMHLDALRSEPLATTDAIVTVTPGTGVFLTFADCVPVVFYDRRQHVLAFAHIGWRSMAMGFAGKVAGHLKTNYASKAEDLRAVIGPCIKKESYLFADPIQASNPVWEPFLHPAGDGRQGIDLIGFCKSELAAAGLAPEHVFASPIDTAQDESMFSHYAATAGGRPEKQGRIIFWAYLQE